MGYVAVRAEGVDGWGRYTVELVRAIRDRGVEPVLVTSHPEVDPGLEGVEQHPILPRPLAGPLGVPLSLLAAGRLRHVLATCDVVHGIVERYAPLIALSRPRRMPFVQTAHGSWAVLPFRSRLRRGFHRAALKQVDLLVIQSQYTREQIVREVELPRHAVWPAGVKATDFEASDASGLPGWARRGPLVLSVGALRPRKGHAVALEAVGRASREFANLQFVVIGADEGRGNLDRLRAQAVVLGLADRAHFLGRVAFRDLQAWYRRADLMMLLPTNLNGSFEGLGLVYLEAGAAGKPSIATDHCGAAEAVIHEQTGILVPQHDPYAAAAALTRLLGDPGLRERMGQAARQHALRFSWDHLAERLKEAYGELVDSKRAA